MHIWCAGSILYNKITSTSTTHWNIDCLLHQLIIQSIMHCIITRSHEQSQRWWSKKATYIHTHIYIAKLFRWLCLVILLLLFIIIATCQSSKVINQHVRKLLPTQSCTEVHVCHNFIMGPCEHWHLSIWLLP